MQYCVCSSLFLLVGVLISLHGCLARSGDAGIRTAITSKGLDYITAIGIPLLREELATVVIPDISGKSDIKIGKISYKLKNIHITEFEIGSSSLRSSTGKGLTLQISDVSIQVKADWSYKSWIASDSGSVRATGSGFSQSVSILVSANDKGQPNVTTTGCSFDARHLSIKLSGGASWLYNLFDGVFEDQIRKALNDKICDMTSDSINIAANKALRTLPVVVQVDDVSEFSYALVSSPNFTSWYIMTYHKGEFLSVTQPNVDPPFVPSSLPPLPPSVQPNSRMVYLWATDYVANTAAFVYMKAGYLTYNITPSMVSRINPFIKLNTNTFSLFLPELYSKYPNKNMSIGMRSVNKPPIVSITPQGANFTGHGAVDFYVLNGKYKPLVFTLGVVASIDMNVSLIEDTKNNQLLLKGNATYLNAELSVLVTHVGDIDVSKFQDLFDTLSQSFVIPEINKYVNKGFPIPMVDELNFINPSLSLGKGYVVIQTDIVYHPPEDESNMTEIS